MEPVQYDHDIIAWAKEQAQLVRTKQFSDPPYHHPLSPILSYDQQSSCLFQ